MKKRKGEREQVPSSLYLTYETVLPLSILELSLVPSYSPVIHDQNQRVDSKTELLNGYSVFLKQFSVYRKWRRELTKTNNQDNFIKTRQRNTVICVIMVGLMFHKDFRRLKQFIQSPTYLLYMYVGTFSTIWSCICSCSSFPKRNFASIQHC